MVSVIESAIQKSQVYFTRLSKWKNKIDLQIDCGPYQLKMATTTAEVIECFRLRHEVFCKEMAGRSTKSGLDYDQFDTICDHLIIVHQPTKKIVGTYRINFSKTSTKFYTETEFKISDWLDQLDESFIELGRACIQSEHRRGVVISLLWRGIAEYMKIVEAPMLLGCSSVKVVDTRSAALVYKYFEVHGALNSEIFSPHEKYQMKDFLFWMMVFANGLNEQQIIEAEEKIPSLLKSYIKAGAKVCSYPALDLDFSCVDLMTVLRRSDLDQKLAKKYQA